MKTQQKPPSPAQLALPLDGRMRDLEVRLGGFGTVVCPVELYRGLERGTRRPGRERRDQ